MAELDCFVRLAAFLAMTLNARMIERNFNPSIYFVADPSLCAGRDIVDVVSAALRGGVTMVQYRNKSGDMKEIYAQAAMLAEMLASCPHPNPPPGRGREERSEGGGVIPFIINDHIDVAFAVGADGVHLGQGDASAAEARAKLGANAIIGQTAFTKEQIVAVDPDIIDYIGLGPFYITQTKKGKDVLGPVEQGGNGRFSELAALSPVPVVGIGGITPANAQAVMEAGAAGVAMMRSISEAENIEQAARAFHVSLRGTQ
ncbi:MAG: thiamine phosphate synthase [Rhodospirillales bacterium]|nr:thiamine phosphate synthase [Rhodospirillales bacterium]